MEKDRGKILEVEEHTPSDAPSPSYGVIPNPRRSLCNVNKMKDGKGVSAGGSEKTLVQAGSQGA
jgi:hypothetical protein